MPHLLCLPLVAVGLKRKNRIELVDIERFLIEMLSKRFPLQKFVSKCLPIFSH